jgi:signal transduction histidine kinase
VATLVADGAPPEQVSTAVTAEIGRVLDVDLTVIGRYDTDGAMTILGRSTRSRAGLSVPSNGQVRRAGPISRVFETGRPVRLDNYADDVAGPGAGRGRSWGLRSVVAVPIVVDARQWGIILVAHTYDPLAADTEARLAGFNELLTTAVLNARARTELRRLSNEQAALRRVATLVAQAAPPEQLFTAVAAEVGRLLEVDFTVLSRYDRDGLVTVVGNWARTDRGRPLAIGLRLKPEGRNVHAAVHETRQSARIDDYDTASGSFAHVARGWGYRSAVGTPISVDGGLWGVIIVGSRSETLPEMTELRLAGFTELVGTAIADAQSRAALTAACARVVAAADASRRRVERDLHDGAQQRLVSLALHVRGVVRPAVPNGSPELVQALDDVADELDGVLADLREIARGLHPTALAAGGLRPALKALARRSPVPVRLDIRADSRLPEQIELAAYYVVAETLTNVAKHAQASVVDVEVAAGDGVLRVRVADDGRGGADLAAGTGLLGLTDRVEALGGHLSAHSPAGGGTTIDICLPCTALTDPLLVPPAPEPD